MVFLHIEPPAIFCLDVVPVVTIACWFMVFVTCLFRTKSFQSWLHLHPVQAILLEGIYRVAQMFWDQDREERVS